MRDPNELKALIAQGHSVLMSDGENITDPDRLDEAIEALLAIKPDDILVTSSGSTAEVSDQKLRELVREVAIEIGMDESTDTLTLIGGFRSAIRKANETFEEMLTKEEASEKKITEPTADRTSFASRLDALTKERDELKAQVEELTKPQTPLETQAQTGEATGEPREGTTVALGETAILTATGSRPPSKAR